MSSKVFNVENIPVCDTAISTNANESGSGSIILLKCEAKAPTDRLKSVKNKTTVLHPARIDIPHGCITAIIGTAESGKSTLLKFMAGCPDKSLGCEGIVNLPGKSAYVPKVTNLHRFYTPRTYIKHYDRMLCSGETHPNRMNGEDVERLLDGLRIDYHRRDTAVGDAFQRGLSLGERRRLELGLSVLSAPDTLFMEHPVEGLDSATSLHIMEFLKGYCSNSSRRVVITLNRPSLYVWQLIDNVILLSRGHVVFEGSRLTMEPFFAEHGVSTPARYSEVEHYLAVVNNFRRPREAVNWETAFRTWQQSRSKKNSQYLISEDTESCFPMAIPNVVVPHKDIVLTDNDEGFVSLPRLIGETEKYPEIVRRYVLQLLLNPGILQIRLAMYTMLSLFLGALFFNMEKDYQESQSINSHAALLFYSSSFYIFMVCATLPFLAIDLQIRDKEVLNGLYHPITHHLAVTICTIPACLILSLVISVIQVNMVGLQNGIHFFLILTLALWCGDALAMFISLLAPHFVIGIVVCAGICGFFMALEGFMLVPSMFPSWLRWTYTVPFHTYVFRSLMFNEFHGDALGEKVLQSYKIDSSSAIWHDVIVLLCYGVIIHLLRLVKIFLDKTHGTKRQLKKKS